MGFNPLVLAQIAHQIIAATVSGQHGAGATLADGAQQSWPVGVIAQLETMVIPPPTTVAANTHPAGGKTGAGIAKAPHPGRARSRWRREDQLPGKVMISRSAPPPAPPAASGNRARRRLPR